MTIVFYISGHGFGHASRQVEIINALAGIRPGLRVIVRSAVSPHLLARTIRAAYELRAGPCDTGIIQSSSVAHDDEATAEQAIAFFSTLGPRADGEAAHLSSDQVRLVVGDIPPLAFEVGERLGVPSVAIANFTWDWIYESQPGFEHAPWLLPAIRSAYAKATMALQLPFAGGFEVFPAVRQIPLVARRPARSREDTRTYFRIPAERPAVLLSFGGYGLPMLDVARVDCLTDWTLVTTDLVTPPAGARAKHVVYVPEEAFVTSGFRYEDLVAAVDVVATKPGYGIIAECIATGTPMLYTSRGRFREYDLLVAEMPKYLRARFISHGDLFGGRWRASLDALLSQPPPPETMPTNGAEVAAAEIEKMTSEVIFDARS